MTATLHTKCALMAINRQVIFSTYLGPFSGYSAGALMGSSCTHVQEAGVMVYDYDTYKYKKDRGNSPQNLFSRFINSNIYS